MKTPDKYNLMYDPKPWRQRVIGTMIFYAFLAFLVWLSIGSIWWTFFFGSVAIFAFSVHILKEYEEGYNCFHTKAELITFVESLPDSDHEANQELKSVK